MGITFAAIGIAFVFFVGVCFVIYCAWRALVWTCKAILDSFK